MPQVCASGGLKRQSIRAGNPSRRPSWSHGGGFGPALQSEINTGGFAASGISSDSWSRSSHSRLCFLGVVGGFGRENLAAHRCSNLL
jgi:hypothetical protein